MHAHAHKLLCSVEIWIHVQVLYTYQFSLLGYVRTCRFLPSHAQIKILKRKSDGSPPTHPTSAHAPSTKQYKTLAEREAEYASARCVI